MRQLSAVVVMAAMLVFGSGIVTAAEKASGGASKKPATSNLLNAPQSVSGEIVNVIPGESVQIKQENGKLRTYGLSKKTKIDGELKVGEMASVSSAGRWAQQITVQAADKMLSAADPLSQK